MRWSLSDEWLVETLYEATRLELDTDFIEILQHEINQRNLNIDLLLSSVRTNEIIPEV